MTNRFASGLSIINATIKTRETSCQIPVNKLTIQFLRILRNQGFIWGFSFCSPQKRRLRLYPRVTVYLKYVDSNSPVLKAISLFKRTHSNFHIIRNNKLYQVLAQNKLYLLTTPKGLSITSLSNFYKSKAGSNNIYSSGKLLAEIFI